jgi:hypothetical protein
MLGAVGVNLGTRFIASKEAPGLGIFLSMARVRARSV